jgi:hypothetical protein
MKKKNWIAGAIKRKGALRRELGAARGKPIRREALESAAKQGGRIGKQANLALTLRKFRKK